MGTAHKSYRLDEALLADVEAYAEAHGLKASEAVSRLMRAGLDATEDATEDGPETGPDGATAAAIAALTTQLAEKDEQIRAALAVASQAQAISYRALEAPPEPEPDPEPEQGGESLADAPAEKEAARESWRVRLARLIAGE
jgi:hypothetical protein